MIENKFLCVLGWDGVSKGIKYVRYDFCFGEEGKINKLMFDI